jgi:adenosylcobinamide kinase / adenosylcobinamide-phosphate guanylyltransferase
VTERLVLVLGGTRSGKSRFGLRRARELANGTPVTFFATARPGDPELDDRIRRHRLDRPGDWPTVDVADDLAADVRRVPPATTILLDGLTLWLSAIAGDELVDIDPILDGPFARAVEALRERQGPAVVVSDEIGLGMVPLDPLARAFRDLLGIANQRLAAAADEVHLLVAGLPVTLRDR